MSVLSWRSLSFKTCFCAFLESIGSATIQSPLKLFFISILGLAACVSEPVSLVFDTSKLSQQEWARMQNECDYEAEKATASAPVNIAYYRWKRLYIGCIELRGIKYLGTTDDFPHLRRNTAPKI